MTFDDKAAAGYVCTYNGSSVLVMFNLGDEQAKVKIPEDSLKVSEVRGYLLAHCKSDFGTAAEYDDTINLDGQELTMPAHSVMVLK